MAETASGAIQFVEKHMREQDGGYIRYSAWYAGVTDDPKRRLFVEHEVDEKNDAWAYAQCVSESAAREAEKLMLGKGCKGGTGGGRYPNYLYVYKISYRTNP